MESAVFVIVNGVATSISDGALCWYEEEDGLGLVEPILLTETAPGQDGEAYLGFKLPARSIQLGLRVTGEEADLNTKRTQLVRLFRPRPQPIALRYDLVGGVQRQIDVTYAGGMGFNSRDRRGASLKVGVMLRAPDAVFYDPIVQGQIFGVGGGAGAGFTFPLSFPVTFGASTIDQTKAIAYAGDWDSAPVVQLTGPMTSPIITNTTTGAVLDFSGAALAVGETWLIDTRRRARRVYDPNVADPVAANRIRYLSDASTLAAFRLVPDNAGVNELRVQLSSATSATEVMLRYYHTYLGI
jgi:hypothetical protein